MKIIFAVGNSGTKHLVIERLIAAYSRAEYSIYEQMLGTKVQDAGLYYESTIEKTLAYISDYINFYQDEYDVLIMSGWEINKHIKHIFEFYKNTAEFVCIKLNEDYDHLIDSKYFSNSWDQSPAHLAVKQEMTQILEAFYADKHHWFSADLEPIIDNLRIMPSNGAHKISILSAVNK